MGSVSWVVGRAGMGLGVRSGGVQGGVGQGPGQCGAEVR